MRSQYAFTAAVGVTFVIALIWVVSLPSRLEPVVAVESGKDTPSGGFSRALSNLTTSVPAAFKDKLGQAAAALSSGQTEPSAESPANTPVDFRELKVEPTEGGNSPSSPATSSGRVILIATSTEATATTSATTSR